MSALLPCSALVALRCLSLALTYVHRDGHACTDDQQTAVGHASGGLWLLQHFLALQTINQVSGGSFCKTILKGQLDDTKSAHYEVELTLLRSS